MFRTLTFLCSSMLLAPFALAGEPAAAPPAAPKAAALEKAERTVREKLVKPLAAVEEKRSKFSRARMPPSERRVRILDEGKDEKGATFVAFAIDERWAYADDQPWEENAVEGCLYAKDAAIFVKYGDHYRSSAVLLGKKSKTPPEHVCTAMAPVADPPTGPIAQAAIPAQLAPR